MATSDLKLATAYHYFVPLLMVLLALVNKYHTSIDTSERLFQVSNKFSLYENSTPIIIYGSSGYCVQVVSNG